ncbi:MAG: aldo/keto reductase [Pseudomonadota bacterium]
MVEASVRQLFMRLQGRRPLGFGVSGPLATRLFAPHETDRLIGTARDQGITIFDTAPSYGAGLGERRLGRAVGNDPSVFVMTKAGLTAKRCLQRVSNFSPENITESVEASLRRLKRDRIDLLWLHGPGRHQIDQPLKDALSGLILAGKVAAVGIASRNQAASAMAETAPFSAVMAPVYEAVSALSPFPPNVAFFGIEGFRHVPTRDGLPRNRSQFWRATRAILRGQQSMPGSISVDAALDYAFASAQCNVLVTTTTKSTRIVQNRIVCDEVLDRLRVSETHVQEQVTAGSR